MALAIVLSCPILSPAEAQQTTNLDPTNPDAWSELGILELRGGNLAGAQASFERSLTLGEQRGDKLTVARASLNLGRVQSFRYAWMATDSRVAAMWGGPRTESAAARTVFEKAEAAFESALSLSAALDRKALTADSYSALGHLYRSKGELTRAQAMLEKSLDLNTVLGAKEQLATNYRDLGDLHSERRDRDRAEAMYREALALQEALGRKGEVAMAYADLAGVHKDRGQLDEAERLYRQALALADGDGRYTIVRALEALYRTLGDKARSEEMMREADALAKEAGAGGIIFAASYYFSGRYSREQLAHLEKASPLEKALGHSVGLAVSTFLLGHHYQHRGDLERAEAMFRDVLALSESLGRQDELATLYAELGRVLEKRGDKVQACAYWRKGAVAFPEQRRLTDLLNRGGCALQ